MKKSVLISILLLVLVSMACLSIGCGITAKKENPDPDIKEETEEASVSSPKKRPEVEQNSVAEKDTDDKITEDAVPSDPLQDASESEPETSDDTFNGWPMFETPGDVLDNYLKEHDSDLTEDPGYQMYDVNADGYEELIITEQDKIVEIYGTYKGKYHRAFSTYEDYEVTLYPEGMLKLTAPDSAEYTKTIWKQYYPEYGDFLPVFEESMDEYYTFCAYDLSEVDKEEINRSLEDIQEYPVWIGEWFDMLSKKEYEKLVPKTKPVKLLKPDAFSDRSALEVKPEMLLYVKASDGYANLRTGPGTEYEIICQIPNGDEMEMYYKNATSASGKTWLKVTYFMEADNEDGYTWLTGWIAESQLE